MKYLKLIRWKVLVALVLSQFVIKYAYFAPFDVPITLNWFGLALLSLSTVCLGAAGFIINALYTVEAQNDDTSAKQIIGKSISVKMAYRLFFGFSVVGILIGFYLANIVGHPGFAMLFILASALLYARAGFLKKYALIGSLISSFLLGLSVLGVGLFDLVPAITNHNRLTITTFFSILTDYAVFIALLSVVRELLINQKNIDSDYKINRRTLPLILGRDRSNKIICVFTFLPALGVAFYIYQYLYLHTFSLVYALVLILGPLFYVLFKVVSATQKRDYIKLNKIVIFVMICSILSLGLHQFILLS